MTNRERNLAILTFSIVGFGAIVLLANKLIFAPANEAKTNIASLRVEIGEKQTNVGMERSFFQKLNELVARSFGSDRDQASANSREFIMQMLTRSGLRADTARTTPLAGTRLKNKSGYEIGWNVTVVGSLEKITNLLYLLQNDKHLFKVNDISWSPVTKSTDVTLQFKLVTLILEFDPPAKDRLPSLAAQIEDFAWFLKAKTTTQPTSSSALRSDERKQYAMIAERDIFRPYIKKPPPPPRRPDPPTRTTNNNTKPDPPRPPRVSYALVGLPQFNEDPEVMVKDSKSGKTRFYKIGEDLMGGEIVMVDYRGLPHLKNPELQSPSRVILRIGRDYWAVELGDDFANKYRMKSDRLPSSLRQPEAIKQTKPDTSSNDAVSSSDSKLITTDTPSIDAKPSKETNDAE